MNTNPHTELLKRLESIRKHIHECDDMDNPTRGKLFADIDFVISDLMSTPTDAATNLEKISSKLAEPMKGDSYRRGYQAGVVERDVLEEMIEKCSIPFYLHCNVKGYWYAYIGKDSESPKGQGQTSCEAIENLLKALKQQ